MRFLALQTNVNLLKKQFIVEGEKEILSTRHHSLSFLVTVVATTMILLVFAGLILSGFGISGIVSPALSAGIFMLVFLFCLYRIINAWIYWRYNFLIVTTEKIVLIRHRSFTYQNVNPIHLEDIERTRFESQYFGIWRCGIVHICLKERESGTTREFVLSYIPQPDVVASAIENAIALEKQRSKHQETSEDQMPKVQDVQQKVQESVQKEAAATATVEPPKEQVTENPPQSK